MNFWLWTEVRLLHRWVIERCRCLFFFHYNYSTERREENERHQTLASLIHRTCCGDGATMYEPDFLARPHFRTDAPQLFHSYLRTYIYGHRHFFAVRDDNDRQAQVM
jgi:hypothetical protein